MASDSLSGVAVKAIGRWRKRLVWLGVSTAALVGVGAWLFYFVATPRLGSQNEMEGLAAPSGLDWDHPSDVDSLISVLATAYAERPANAGISIGVTRNGRRHVVSRGVKSLDDPELLVDDETLFEIGSVTKTFTGVALAKAVLDGRTSLGQPIGDLLPTSIAFPEHVRSLSVGALATHSSGLPRNPPSLSLFSEIFRKNPVGRVTEQQAFESLARVPDQGMSSAEFGYSNFGFMLLGRLVEEATGLSYARLIEERVAGQLGMDHTWVDPPASELSQLAVGHRVGRPVEHWYDVPLPGAQGIVSSVPDLLTYLEAHLMPDATPLRGVVEFAMQPRLRASETVEVALGWNVYTVPGVPRIVYHHGSTMGFRSYAGMAPEIGLGVVVLGNSRDPTLSAIGRLVMRTLTGGEG